VEITTARLRAALKTDWRSLLLAPPLDSIQEVLGPDPEEAVERLRERNTIRGIREALEDRAPNVLRVLLHERD